MAKNLNIDFDRPAKDNPKLRSLFEDEKTLSIFEDWCFSAVGPFLVPYPINKFLTKRFLERQ